MLVDLSGPRGETVACILSLGIKRKTSKHVSSNKSFCTQKAGSARSEPRSSSGS